MPALQLLAAPARFHHQLFHPTPHPTPRVGPLATVTQSLVPMGSTHRPHQGHKGPPRCSSPSLGGERRCTHGGHSAALSPPPRHQGPWAAPPPLLRSLAGDQFGAAGRGRRGQVTPLENPSDTTEAPGRAPSAPRKSAHQCHGGGAQPRAALALISREGVAAPPLAVNPPPPPRPAGATRLRSIHP